MADGKGSAVLTSHPRARLVLISPGCTASAVSAPHPASLRGGRRETRAGRAVRAAWQDGTGAANTHPLAQFKRERPEYTDTTQATLHPAPLLPGERQVVNKAQLGKVAPHIVYCISFLRSRASAHLSKRRWNSLAASIAASFEFA